MTLIKTQLGRIPIDKYALGVAKATSLRSEDPHLKVGAVALSYDNRVVGCAYNGTPSGFQMENSLLSNRAKKSPFMIHAETNLCTLFKRGEVNMVAITHAPCSKCFINLLAHGVKEIIYDTEYIDDDTKKLSEYYAKIITLKKVE